MSCRTRRAWKSLLWSLAGLAGASGCATLAPPPIPLLTGTEEAVSSRDPDYVQRAGYVEDKYKGDELYKPKKSGDESIFDSFSAEAIGGALKKAAGQGPNPSTARQLFTEAETLYARALKAPQGDERQAAFLAAAERYAEAAERWPGSVLAEDSLFMAGEGYFFADNYPSASEMYDGLTKNYPNTRHLDVVDAHRFAIAQYWLSLNKARPESWYEVNLADDSRPWRDTRGFAHKVFDRIRLDDPTGKLADDATMASANAYFVEGDFLAADDLYTDLRKSFPSSEHQFDAHFLGLKTKLQCYDGPDYSDEALNEAEQLVKQIRKQFPHKAAEQKEFLDRAFAEVRFRKAERLWTLGRYYELQGAYGAANVQFERLAAEFPETPFAKQAEDAVRANAGKPPVPPQPFEPIVKMFPERQIAKPLIPNDDPANRK